MKTRCNFACAALAVIVFQFAGIHPQPVCAAEVVAWGYNNYGQTNVPPGLSNVVAVAAGYYHNVALRADGSVAAWGYNSYGQTNVPPGLCNVVAVAAGESHSVALRADGSVAAWGDNYYGQTNVPLGLSNVVAVAAGRYHSLALRVDGTLAAWGYNGHGETNVPSGLSNVVAVAAGYSHNVVLRADGTVAAWGNNDDGKTNIPSGLSNVVAVAAGGSHSAALRADGTVAAWGNNDYGKTNIPSGLSNVVAVAAGRNHSLALRVDGTLAAWGNNNFGQTNVPSGLSNVVAVASVDFHSLVLAGYGPPFTMLRLVDQSITSGGTARFIMAASGAVPLSYQWRLNGTNLASATNAWLVLTNVQANQAGTYSVVASNSFGTASSSEGILTVFSGRTRFITSSGGLFVSGGQLHLLVEGSTETQFILEKSEDLKNWMPAQTNTLSAGVMRLNEPTGTNNHQFFRMNAPNAAPNP